MPEQLDHAQLYALEMYARANGRYWKSKLHDDWMNGRSSGTLQQIRNSFGPTWLTRFNLKRAVAADWYRRVHCDQCQMLAINGVACHEIGCPNMGARWDRGDQAWVKQRECFDCGCTVDADDPCCSAREEEEE
jgi:hypothetical protein